MLDQSEAFVRHDRVEQFDELRSGVPQSVAAAEGQVVDEAGVFSAEPICEAAQAPVEGKGDHVRQRT